MKKKSSFLLLSILIFFLTLIFYRSLLKTSYKAIRYFFGPAAISLFYAKTDKYTVKDSIPEQEDLLNFKLSIDEKILNELPKLYERLERIQPFEYAYSKKINKWRPATLTFKNEAYPAKVKIHGKAPTGHRSGKYISLKIKLKNKKKINNFNKFSFIIYDRLKFPFETTKYLAKEFKLIHQEVDLVTLKINDWGRRLFFLEKKIDAKFFAAKNLPSFRLYDKSLQKTPLLAAYDTKKIQTKEGLYKEYEKIEKSLVNVLNEKNIKSQEQKKIIKYFRKINHCIISADVNCIKSYFDEKYLIAIASLRDLLGFSWHAYMYINFFVAHDTSNNLLYPIIHRDVCHSFYETRSNNNSDIEKQLSLHKTHVGDLKIILFNALNTSKEFRLKKYNYLFNYLKQENKLENLALFEKNIKEKFMRLKYGWLGFQMRKTYENLKRKMGRSAFHNAKYILSKLNKTSPEFKFHVKNNKHYLKIKTNDLIPIQIDSIKLNNKSFNFKFNKSYHASLDINANKKAGEFFLEIPTTKKISTENLTKLTVIYKNVVTNNLKTIQVFKDQESKKG